MAFSCWCTYTCWISNTNIVYSNDFQLRSCPFCPYRIGLSVVTLEKALEINRISAKVGDNVEIRCDVSGNPPPPIVWKRYSADLTTLGDEDVRVFSDGSLYLTKIQLVHAGNYTCRALRNSEVTQTHVLTVHSTYSAIQKFRITVYCINFFTRLRLFFFFFHSFLALPEVKVTPRIQSRRPGEKTSMFCHVIGEPFPEVSVTPSRLRQYVPTLEVGRT